MSNDLWRYACERCGSVSVYRTTGKQRRKRRGKPRAYYHLPEAKRRWYCQSCGRQCETAYDKKRGHSVKPGEVGP
jgi:hypothetical protein